MNKRVKLNRAKICTGKLYTEKGNYCPIGKVAAYLYGLSIKEAYVQSYKTFDFAPYCVVDELGIDPSVIFNINDRRGLSRKDKEKRIKAEFKKAGINIEYCGEYKK